MSDREGKEGPHQEADRLIEAGKSAERAGNPAQARGHFEDALRALDRNASSRLACQLLRWIAWTHHTEGDAAAAFDCLDAAEAVATAADDPSELASVLNTRAGTLFGLGELDDAVEIFGRVRALAVRTGDRTLQAIADQNLGSVASIRGDMHLALDRFQASLDAYEGMDETAYIGPLLNNIGRLHLELHEDGPADRILTRARKACLEADDQHHLVIVDVNRARLHLRRGEAVQALRICEEARRLSERSGDERWEGEILLVSGSIHQSLGNSDVALGFLERAAAIAREREDPKLIADVALQQATALRKVGRNRDTLLRLTEAHRLFERLRARRDVANVGAHLAELEGAFLQIVRDWGESIESKDAYTQGHCSRVADYTCLLAAAAGLSEAEIKWIRMGALLHDVGKVAVPLSILNKKGKLDDDEWAVMRQHPVFGIDLLEGIEFPWDVRPMIRHHHERWDGKGYPDGIAGEEIPFEARILTIADIYDALTTTRSYRTGFSHEKAMDILRSEVGETVDAELLAVFDQHVAPRIEAGTVGKDQPGAGAEAPSALAG
ncbi:MAG: tetratricopeptide repeat protein [Gemmatimonadetes bacterium]|nr:tetratricopeptide repeat protein [Gemmatimonadota bacterium]